MGLEKAIIHGKEWRKPYYNSGRFDRTCRPHGGCPWCECNRKHSELCDMPLTDYPEDATIRGMDIEWLPEELDPPDHDWEAIERKREYDDYHAMDHDDDAW